jgi:dTDP-4-amino-4,6-dideoxygalactose transaminase
MMIPLNDLKRENLEIGGAIRDVLHRVQENGWFILGEELTRFEREFAAYIGSSYWHIPEVSVDRRETP